MADANSTQEAKFAAAVPSVYLHNPAASSEDRLDQLTARLGQLSAMLLLTHARLGTEDSFGRLNATHQDNYMWCCWSLAEECRELAERESSAACKRKEAPPES